MRRHRARDVHLRGGRAGEQDQLRWPYGFSDVLLGFHRHRTRALLVDQLDYRRKLGSLPPPVAYLVSLLGQVGRRRVSAVTASQYRDLHSPTLMTTAIAVSPAAQPVKSPCPPPRWASSSISSITERVPVGPCGCPQTSEQP